MAAPNDATLENLNGKWTLDKSLSSPTDPLLALQGMNWVVRKAIGMSSVILDIKEFHEVENGSATPLTRIEILQSTTSGLPGTSEKRYIDWEERTQEDHIFGKCVVRARWICDSKNVNGRTLPVVDIQTTLAEDENIVRFLAGEVGDDLRPSEGFLVEKPQEVKEGQDGLWLQLFIRHVEGKWTAEQIWGFEMIGGERRYVRRVVVANAKGQHGLARLVYSFES
ncbi:uncharacterized protein BJX67DRAFT_387825 [Aspergillus lucknowensis]|uniref:Calycin-like protein n=1 Tax=Aspergillus lucknowensis TaxID=176173 RepID=A0ABR4LSR8_9EURO